MRLSPLAIVIVSLVGCGSSEPAPTSGSGTGTAPPVGHPCTEMACSDQGLLVVHYDAAHFRAGAHHFEIRADAQTIRCDATITALTEDVFATCDGAAEVHVGAEMRTVDMEVPGMPGVVGITSEVVPGRFHASIGITGTPASIHVVHTIDGAAHSDRTAAITYGEHRPNGPDCEPVCRQGRVEVDGF